MNTNDLYPVYLLLFSNDTGFGKIIRKATGSDYSHAVISLDSSMNNMYSFSVIPYTHSLIGSDGFVRESLWSPMFRENRYFTVMATFVTKEEYDTIKSKIDYFCTNFMKFKYNTVGLIQYYFNFKETKGHSEEKKRKWFCSEFVAYMCKAGNIKSFNDIMLSPQDIKEIKNPNVINLGDFTIPEFKESIIIKKTEEARKQFIKNMNTVSEAFYFNYNNILEEASLKDIFSRKKKEYKPSVIQQYTSLVDWKYLYDQFIKLFPDTDPNVRFDVFEMIVRRILIPFKRKAENATHEIYMETKNIFRIVGRGTIKTVDAFKGLLYVKKDDKTYVYQYPVMTCIDELAESSYDDIETLMKKYGTPINNIRTEMEETYFV